MSAMGFCCSDPVPEFVAEDPNLVQVIFSKLSLLEDRKNLLHKIGGRYAGYYTWRQWKQCVCDTAMALHAIGIRKGDLVGILAENSPEWTIADLAILSLGAVTVPVYPTSSVKDIHYIIDHAKLKAFFLSNDEQFQKIKEMAYPFVPGRCILFISKQKSGGYDLSSFMKMGRCYALNNGGLFERCLSSVRPDDLATVIYTSGTTGPAKGVMLTHRNFISNCFGCFEHIKISERDTVLSFLPLSHVFERLAGYYFMSSYGVTIAYAESNMTVAEDIRHIRPTIMIAVPRFYEKTHARILEKVRQAPGWQRALFDWAVRVGTQASQLRMERKKLPLGLALRYQIAKILVFNKIKRAMGGRIRFFISGGAPLSRELAKFFFAADILILEGYGLTETSPVIAVNTPKDFKFGTVGRPLPNIRVKIAEDGEILIAGPSVMKGYYNDAQATSEILRENWLYTGDIGLLDGEGHLQITDRKKDIIVTAGGKNVSPQNIERHILKDDLFSQVVVIGDQKPYLAAIIVPQKDAMMRHAEAMGVVSPSYEEILQDPKIQEFIQKRLDQCLDGLANYEKVKCFMLLAHELTQTAGELTPTLKIKRREIMSKYRTLLDKLYEKNDERWLRLKSSGHVAVKGI